MDRCRNISCEDQNPLCGNGCSRYHAIINIRKVCPDFSDEKGQRRLDEDRVELVHEGAGP